MTVAGVMSGTSADGIDVALVRITPKAGRPKITLLAHHAIDYPAALRRTVLASMNAPQTSTAELARLNWRLGIAYAEAVRAAIEKHPVKLDLIGCHGQTIYHQAKTAAFLGRQIACTWQIGEPALIAQELGVPVVSNFRPADMVAGGQGAPLVPLLDFVLFAHPKRARILQNLGGIGNLTAIPANATPDKLIAFDTGPGNMVIDALVSHKTQGRQHYDRDGRIAKASKIHSGLLKAMLSDPYLALAPPKSAGREQFGHEFASGLIATGVPIDDLIATATEFTAQSIAHAIHPFEKIAELIVSGGGVHNRQIMRRLRELLPHFAVTTTKTHGIDPDAKEAIAFAILAYEHVQGRPANIPSATGARHAAILGKRSPA